MSIVAKYSCSLSTFKSNFDICFEKFTWGVHIFTALKCSQNYWLEVGEETLTDFLTMENVCWRILRD